MSKLKKKTNDQHLDKQKDGQMDGWKDGQTLFWRTLPATAGLEVLKVQTV